MMNAIGSLSAVTPELVLLVATFLIFIVTLLRPRMRLFTPYFGAAAALLAAVYAASQGSGPSLSVFHATLRIDLWSVIARTLVYASTAAALLLFAPTRFSGMAVIDGRPVADKTLLMLCAALGAGLLAAAQDLLVMVLGIELISVATSLAVLSDGERTASAAVGKSFIVTTAATAVMLFGLAFLFGERGHTRFAPLDATNARMMIGWALFATGLLVKMGVVPFHSGAADLKRFAAAPMVAFFASAVLVGVFAAAGRFVFWTQPASPEVVKTFIVLTAATIFFGNAAALLERDLGRLIAVSLVAHAGFLLMGATATLQARNPNGLAALLFTLIATAPALLVLVAVIGQARLGRRPDGADRSVESLRGLWRAAPSSALALTVVLLSLAGLPLTLGFQARFGLFTAALQAGQVGLLGVAGVNALFAAWCHLRLVREIFLDAENPPDLFTGMWQRVILHAGAIFLLFFGLFPDRFLRLVAEAALGLMPS